MGGRHFSGKMQSEKFGLMGFRPATITHGDYLGNHPSFLATLQAAWRDLTTNLMI